MSARFQFESPNYTQTPNDFFDVLLKEIDDVSELKVTLTAIRMTVGYHKQAAELSIEYLMQSTGLARNSVRRGLALALKRGTIHMVKSSTNRTGGIYALNVRGSAIDPLNDSRGSAIDPLNDSRGSAIDPLEGQPLTPLKKVKKDNHNHKSDSENLDSAFGKAFSELCDVLTLSPFAIEKFKDLWQDFPDPRRHERALERLKQKNDPNYNYYDTVFRNFNPDYVPPTRSSARVFPAPAPQNKPRAHTEWTPADIEAHKRTLAARRAEYAEGNHG